MPAVMIRCPRTDQPVPTGIDIDAEEFPIADLNGKSFVCSACGERHVWNKSDAFLDEE